MDQRKLTRKEKLALQRLANSSNAEVGSKRGQPVTGKKADKKKSRSSIPGIFIAALAFILYANSLQNDFVLDDVSAIKKNWVVKQGVSSFPIILKTSYRYGYRDSDDELYRPLPLMIFATLWQWFPENPFPFHLLNVLAYALTGLVLFNLLRKLFKDYHPLLAFAATILFIAHPLHTEVVANIKSLDEILSFLFVLITVQHLIRYLEKRKNGNLFYAWIFFFLAFLCKEGTIVMLAGIPLMLYMFANASKEDLVKMTVVLSVAAIVFIAMRANALGGMAVGKKFQVQENVLTVAPNMGVRFATIFFVLLQYLKLFVWPDPLSSDYSFPSWNLASWSSPLPWISLLLYAAMLFVAIKYFRKNKIVSFAILFFFITVSLYSNLLMTIGSLFGERFLYIPLLGFAVVVSWLILKLLKIPVEVQGTTTTEIFSSANNKAFAALAVFILPYSFLSVSRNADWKDTVTLFSNDVKHTDSALLHYNYANELKAEKAEKETNATLKSAVYDSAIYHYKRALELYPGYDEVYEQLGLSYYRKGMDSAAFSNIEKSLELNPNRSTAYNSLGTLYFEKKKDYNRALELYQEAVRRNPNYIDGWRNLGAAYGTLGQLPKAIEAFQRVLILDPVNVTVLNFVAQTYRSMGDQASAELYERKAREASKMKM
jgi:tetratricopeptide (TPR) repeat protein